MLSPTLLKRFGLRAAEIVEKLFLRTKLALRLFSALLLLLTPHANSATVEFLVSDSAKYYEQVAQTITHQLTSKYPEMSVRSIKLGEEHSLSFAEDSLIITVGTAATITAAEQFPTHPQLGLIITEAAWGKLPTNSVANRRAALFIDQPVNRLITLANIVAPQAKRYSTVLGSVSVDSLPELEATTASMGITLSTKIINEQSNPLMTLTPLIKESDLFIAIPDVGAVNRNIGKWALHLAYKNNVPIIGFSKAYTDAGAIASIYTSLDDISRQAMEWLDNYVTQPDFNGWKTYAPRYFTITVNPSVARSLGYGKLSPEQLHAKVKQRLGSTTQ